MGKKRQVRERDISKEPRSIVGMDAHTKKLALSVWDWGDRFNPAVSNEFKCVMLEDMEAVYRRHVGADSLTIIEATMNAGELKRRLEAIGYTAEIVRSDTLKGKERRRKVCDIQDARNLALAYIHGDIDDFVLAPSKETAERRDLLAAYLEAVKETTRLANRMWSLCTEKGVMAPKGKGKARVDKLLAAVTEAGILGIAKMRFEMLAEDYLRMFERRDRLGRQIAETVATTPEMRALMQLPGVGCVAAFALVAAVGNIRRFATSAKLAAYGGFSPVLDTTGDEEERAKKRGGTGKPLDGEGRREIKTLFAEAGQSVLTLLPETRLGKWGWAMFHRGKPWNKVVCAIGRKLLTYAWHILRGDPTPNRHAEAFFARKMMTLHMRVGAKRMNELGLGTRKDFAQMICGDIYGALPPINAESRETNNEKIA